MCDPLRLLLGSLVLCALALVSLCETGAAASSASLRLHVSPEGSDQAAGTEAAPFATLARARDELRRLRQEGKLPRSGAVVTLADGRYEMAETLELGAEDSGPDTALIAYRAARTGQARLVGGKALRGWEPVTDPAVREQLGPAAGRVMQVDLKAHGIADYGSPAGGGLEVFFRDQPMAMSRWPNEGFTKIADLISEQPVDVRGTKGDAAGKFIYEGDRPSRWVKEKDLWLHGYWFWDWADQRMKVQSLDPARKLITLAPPQHGYGYRKGQWYYALNALCEIDMPGEWYLDRETGLLYFYPPEPVRDGDVVVSVLPTLIRLKDCTHVAFQGLLLEAGRGDAVVIEGGTNDRLAACVIRNVGGNAVTINGGARHQVTGCDMYDTGRNGIAMNGGDRVTLTRADHNADNNHIYRYGRIVRMYSGGIWVNGVGNRVAHNLIDNGPHTAVFFGGNDHLLEYNEIHSVCYESNDAGAIYTGRNWTMRGTLIRYNYLHHINGFEGRGCIGVYLDDMYCGTTSFGNLFYKVTSAAFIGGGRDNTFENNIFVDCNPAAHVDGRALGWASYHAEEWIKEGRAKGTHLGVEFTKPPYSERYPELLKLLDDDPAAPKGNLYARNICVGGRWDNFEAKIKPLIKFEGNLLDRDPGFVDARFDNPTPLSFRLREDSPAYALGFQRLPLERIGLRNDGRRASWPVVTRVRPLPQAPPPPVFQRPGPPAVHKIQKASGSIVVDGNLTPGEWQGLDPAKGIVIEQGIQAEKVAPRSLAWLLHDGQYLYVAVDNQIGAEKKPSTGNVWGQDDAVELALRKPPGKAQDPILILRGYPNGHHESSDEAGAVADLVKQAGAGIEYRAASPGAGRWVCEWRIPLASLGIDPAKVGRLPFNLSVRKLGGVDWFLWQGTGGHTWDVDTAGFIEFAR